MSTALQFTSVFNPANPPQKLNIGGMGMSPKPVTKSRSLPIAASKALEARGIKTEAIKDLETPPPVSVADNDPILVPPPQLERLPFDPRFDDATPMNPMLFRTIEEPNPSDLESMRQLGMILQAQNNMGGIMSTPMKQETGLAALANMNYIDKV
jgi:hypothetical protein